MADAHIGRSQAEIAKMEHQLQDDGLPEWVRADLAARVQEAHQRIAHARCNISSASSYSSNLQSTSPISLSDSAKTGWSSL